ncbi:hypothetical protein F511_38676 [Dorcoceras hygrometricum]|uniref:Uncharacterized protein n=1 Tax=Dorcoceras hygrometricum TaxID=472368 RepID=A0A2Z7DG80_9LAMI|nr:hypothetical protein F511_38676 [Dorcoceras hygrometricum]
MRRPNDCSHSWCHGSIERYRLDLGVVQSTGLRPWAAGIEHDGPLGSLDLMVQIEHDGPLGSLDLMVQVSLQMISFLLATPSHALGFMLRVFYAGMPPRRARDQQDDDAPPPPPPPHMTRYEMASMDMLAGNEDA